MPHGADKVWRRETEPCVGLCVRGEGEHRNVAQLVRPVPCTGIFPPLSLSSHLAKRGEIDVVWLVFYGFALEVFLVR